MRTAIVFDLDGVLVETEPLKARAHRAAVRARGGDLTLETYRREMGNPHGEVIRAFLAASGLEATEARVEAYEAAFRDAYRRLLARELEQVEGAGELLAACREQRRPLALVTSSDPWMVELILPRLGGVGGFGAVVTADDVDREKPHPDPYLRALSGLDEEDGPAVAVEDTAAGLASAAAAGLPVIARRHRFNRGHDFADAAALVETLAPADGFLELVDRLAGGAA